MYITLIIIAVVLSAVGGYGFYAVRKIKNMPEVADSIKIKTLTGKNFKQQIKQGVTLVDFWAAWCAPCKIMAPVLNDIAESENSGGNIGKLNVEDHQTIASQYEVRSIPTMILFKNGKEVNRFVGIKSKDFLLKQMKSA